MPTNNRDIRYLFNEQGLPRIKSKLYLLEDTPLEAGIEKRRKGEFGYPVLGSLLIEDGKYIDNDTRAEVFFDSIVIDSVLVSISQQKNIVKTTVAGRNGTVKEYISDGDYIINVNGVIVSGQNNVIPQGEMQRLKEIFNANVPLKVSNDYLQLFGITDIVVENADVFQREGYRDSVYFNLQAVSDKAYEIRLRQDL